MNLLTAYENIFLVLKTRTNILSNPSLSEFSNSPGWLSSKPGSGCRKGSTTRIRGSSFIAASCKSFADLQTSKDVKLFYFFIKDSHILNMS